MRKPLLYQHMQAQDHLNDTIVVNQPRLQTDDDQLVTVNAAGEMELVDAVTAAAADSKLYIHQDPDSAVEHIIIGGEQITFATSDDDNDGEIVDGIEQVSLLIDQREKLAHVFSMRDCIERFSSQI